MLHAKIKSSNDWKQVHFVKPLACLVDSWISCLYSTAKVWSCRKPDMGTMLKTYW